MVLGCGEGLVSAELIFGSMFCEKPPKQDDMRGGGCAYDKGGRNA